MDAWTETEYFGTFLRIDCREPVLPYSIHFTKSSGNSSLFLGLVSLLTNHGCAARLLLPYTDTPWG
jgi:hypothetical protein